MPPNDGIRGQNGTNESAIQEHWATLSLVRPLIGRSFRVKHPKHDNLIVIVQSYDDPVHDVQNQIGI
jgi:hypothetical protein